MLAITLGDLAWPRWFDLSVPGFVRSFLAPALALPLDVFCSAMEVRQTQPVTTPELWGAAAANAINAVGFPLLIALVAKPLRIDAGYPAFIIVTNWAGLLCNVLLLAASPLLLAGQDGLGTFAVIQLVLLCLSILVVWRTARETLSRERAPVLLVMVLFVAVSAVSELVVQPFG